jgi:hypothetical protein
MEVAKVAATGETAASAMAARERVKEANAAARAAAGGRWKAKAAEVAKGG